MKFLLSVLLTPALVLLSSAHVLAEIKSELPTLPLRVSIGFLPS